MRRRGLGNVRDRKAASDGVSIAFLSQKELLPSEAERQIIALACGEHGRSPLGYKAIAHRVVLEDGRRVPDGRVRSILRGRGLGNSADRNAAKAGQPVRLLPRDEPIPTAVKHKILTLASESRRAHRLASRAIAREIVLADGRRIPETRVESLLREQHRAIPDKSTA